MQFIRDLNNANNTEAKKSLSDTESLKSSFLKVLGLLETIEKHVDAVVVGFVLNK